MATVPYEIFWGKVKLVGYTMHLRPEHMRLIAKDINLRYDEEILVRKYNDTKGLMCDTQFGYKDGLHEP